MTQQENTDLRHLLTMFDATDLGEGDPVAGANTLAAMAFSLANIAPPGSGLRTKDGKTFTVGTNFTVSGELSSGLVTDSVLAGLNTRQNNLISRLKGWDDDLDKEAGKLGSAQADWFKTMPAMRQEPSIGTLYGYNDGMYIRPKDKDWIPLVRTPEGIGPRDLAQRPLMFITGDRPSQLTAQLERSHLGHAFTHVGVGRPEDAARFEQLGSAIVDGRAIPVGAAGTVGGTVVVTDPSGVLGEVVRSDAPATRWLSRTFWLVDGPLGPEPDGPGKTKPPVALGSLELRYGLAMDKAWGRRLNSRSAGPKIREWKFPRMQPLWIAFLKKLEPDFPGITGTARKILATLVFGLRELVGAAQKPEGFKWYTDHVESLAQFLVHRMVNARAAVLHSAANARMLHTQAQILDKLADGPHNVRRLCRRAHRLRSEPCLEALYQLKDSGEVVSIDNEWRLTKSAQGPLLDV